MNTTFRTTSVASLLALAFSGAAFAQQATTVKVGWVHIDPQSSAGTVSGPFTPVDALSMKVKPQSTLFFSVAREINSNLEVELALGVPPKHDVTLAVVKPSAVPSGVAAQDGAVISKVSQVAPTLFVNYKFFDSNSSFRPFVGLGVNYTRFTNPESTATNDAVNGGPTTISMTDSRGLAMQLGATYKISGPWSVTGVWQTAKVNSTVTTNTLGIERKLDVKFNPSVLTLAVGYSF
ncbi:MAG: outer membrane beta-barrel protein [Rhodoferax sp.]|nr:outer membrane beta-barrel protein [Rhodoferax sp.]